MNMLNIRSKNAEMSRFTQLSVPLSYNNIVHALASNILLPAKRWQHFQPVSKIAVGLVQSNGNQVPTVS